jgi:transglutaminase-like putative cysteine protease/tetratricopeptide (TPR) repeat protein
MRKRSSVLLCIHTLTLALTLVVPSLYVREILPLWALPVLGILVTVLTLPYEKLLVRFIPSLLIAGAFFLCLFALVERGFALLHLPQTDGIFLHIGLSSWILVLVCVFSFATTLAFRRFKEWRAMEPFAFAAVLCLFFWPQGNHALTIFAHPVRAALFVGAFLAAILTQIALSAETKPRAFLPLFAYVPISLVLFFAVLTSYNSLSVSNNGGLIQPTLFRFDFSPYLSLKDEIKLNDSLIMIVRTKEENSMALLRRVYLSGWNPEKGFHDSPSPDETPQITAVPAVPTRFADPGFKLRADAEQEYFIVNFDPSSFVSIDYPINVTPYRIWDSRAFNGAFAVTSKISGFMPFELYDCSPPKGGEPGMTAKNLSFYTAIDAASSGKLEPLARDITKNITGYYDRILAINSFFHEGDYRYSLHPGTAPDGDQLSYFLFSSKKGYCTYFAFSMCLMLRSIGIPSRVAAGFFIQPNSGALDYYPVRANMAHAWVEVFFPDYGWISFDPTTTKVADGESVQFSNNPGGEDFYKLLNEIIDKRSTLVPAEAVSKAAAPASAIVEFAQSAYSFLKKFWLLLSIVLIAISFAAVKLNRELAIRHSRNPRKIILLLSRRLYRLLAASGMKRRTQESAKQYVERLQEPDLSAFRSLEQKARFAPECSREDAETAKRLYKAIQARLPRKAKLRAFFTLCALLAIGVPLYPEPKDPTPVSQQPRQAEQNSPSPTEKKLLADARSSIKAENWEGALNLLREGIQAYPANPDFHYALGTLYAKKEIYQSSYKELKTALGLGYADTEIFSDLADVAGFLNEDEEALAYINLFLKDHQDDLFAWSNYGWLCYKTNRLDEGIEALHRVIATYGADGNLYVGLGNLYTASFDYVEARKYYTLAIHVAEERRQTYLASIYYYNRSILEEAFYHFEEAYDDTTKSLAASARSSGYLMQGELELRRLNFMAAINHYNHAISLDSTPLASMGLAETMTQAGYPDQALNYLEPVIRKAELSWIANYGTTTDQYRADIQSILKDIYKYKRNAEKRKVIHNFSTLITKSRNILTWSLRYWYHDALFRIQNKKVARYYEKAERSFNSITSQDLYINSFYFLAFNKWRRIADPYLERAKKIESDNIPDALAAYTYENAKLKQSPALMDDAINALNPEWERKFLAKAIAERLLMEKRPNSPYFRELTSRLYELNPAFFVAYDIRMPVRISIPEITAKSDKVLANNLKKTLLNAGFREDKQAPFVMQILPESAGIRLSLLDNNKNNTIYTQVINNRATSAQKIAQFINNFSTNTFQCRIGL